MTYQRPQRTPAEQAALDDADRRQFWRIAAVFTVAILGVTGLYVAFNSVVEPPSPSTGAAEQVDEPGIPVPDGGAEPTSSGDRGGSEQLALMGGLIVVLGLGVAWVVHSSRKSRQRLAEQRAEHIDAPGDGSDHDGTDVSVSTGSPEPR